MLDRTVPPPFVESKTFALAPAYTQVLSNGIHVFTIRDVQQEVLKIEFLFRSGKWYESMPGVSHFTAHMLEKGTTQKNSTEIAEAFDYLGAHVEISPGYDHTSVSLYALTKNWEQAFALLMEILRHPTFPQEELNLMKSLFIQNLKVNLEKNNFLASQLIRKNVFGENHPYGSSLDEAGANKIVSENLVGFHSECFSPFAAFITVGSSFREDLVLEALSSYSQNEGTADTRNFEVGTTPEFDHIEKPESSQTALRMGRRSVSKKDKDYVDFLLFNHVLGGYFGSRLMKNIREEKGLTYGIYSSLQSFQNGSLWAIGAEVNKENKELALTEIRAELKRLLTVPITPDELKVAKAHFLGSLQSEVANPFAVTDKLKNIFLNRLPEDFYSRLFERVHAFQPEDLIRVGNAHFAIEGLHTITVG